MAALVLFAPLAESQAEGFYVGASAGSSFGDLDSGDIDNSLAAAGLAGSTSTDDNGFGFRLFGGYTLNENLSLELGYLSLGEISADTELANPAGHAKTEIDTSGFNLSLVAGAPVGEGFRIYAKAGLFMWDGEADVSVDLTSGGSASASGDDDGTDFSYGLGASYQVNENLSVRLDWDRYEMKGDYEVSHDLISVGLNYYF
jgi:OOP family OmpA-OmpF porin